MKTKPTPPKDGFFDAPLGEAEPLALEPVGKPDLVEAALQLDDVPIADDWLNDEQLAYVRARLDAARRANGSVGPLTTVDDIFTRFGL